MQLDASARGDGKSTLRYSLVVADFFLIAERSARRAPISKSSSSVRSLIAVAKYLGSVPFSD